MDYHSVIGWAMVPRRVRKEKGMYRLTWLERTGAGFVVRAVSTPSLEVAVVLWLALRLQVVSVRAWGTDGSLLG